MDTKLKIPRYSLKDENGVVIKGHFLAHEMVIVDLERYRATIIKTRSVAGEKQYLHRFKGYGPQFDLWLTNNESDPKYFNYTRFLYPVSYTHLTLPTKRIV